METQCRSRRDRAVSQGFWDMRARRRRKRYTVGIVGPRVALEKQEWGFGKERNQGVSTI